MPGQVLIDHEADAFVALEGGADIVPAAFGRERAKLQPPAVARHERLNRRVLDVLDHRGERPAPKPHGDAQHLEVADM